MKFFDRNNPIWHRHNIVITISILALFITLPLTVLMVATTERPADIRSKAEDIVEDCRIQNCRNIKPRYQPRSFYIKSQRQPRDAMFYKDGSCTDPIDDIAAYCTGKENGDDTPIDYPCSQEGESRCVSNAIHERCIGGQWTIVENCAAKSPEQACVNNACVSMQDFCSNPASAGPTTCYGRLEILCNPRPDPSGRNYTVVRDCQRETGRSQSLCTYNLLVPSQLQCRVIPSQCTQQNAYSCANNNLIQCRDNFLHLAQNCSDINKTCSADQGACIDTTTPTPPPAGLTLHCPFNNTLTCAEQENPYQQRGQLSFSTTAKEGSHSLDMDDDDRLSYRGAGNVNKDRGTVALWVQINGTQCKGTGRDDPDRDSEAYFLYKPDTDRSPGRQPYLVFNDGYLKFESNNDPPGDADGDGDDVDADGYWGGNYWDCPESWQDGEWHHLAAAWEWNSPTDLTTKLWIDGQRQNGGWRCNPDAPKSCDYEDVPPINNIDIGSMYDWRDKAADAYIDDFRVYNKVLTDEEVQEIINETQPPSPTPTPTETPTPTPPTGPMCRADFNGNGDIDIEDLQVFIDEAQQDCSIPFPTPTPIPCETNADCSPDFGSCQQGFCTRNSGPSQCRADFNGNGDIDIEDLQVLMTEAQRECSVAATTPTPTPTQEAGFGRAVKFDPQPGEPREYISVAPSNSLLMTPNFTVEAWIKPEERSLNDTNPHYILARQAGDGYPSEYSLATVNNKVEFGIHLPAPDDDSPRIRKVLVSTMELEPDRWYYVKGVRMFNTFHLVINGQLQATETANVTGYFDAEPSTVTIGCVSVKDFSPCISQFYGEIDEVRLSKIARDLDTMPDSPAVVDEFDLALYRLDGNSNDATHNLNHGQSFGDLEFVLSTAGEL